MRRIDLAIALTAALLVATGSARPAAQASRLHFVLDPQKQVLILMYHQVTDTPIGTTAGEGHYGPAVSPHQFDSDLSYLAQHGFAPADPRVAVRYLTGSADAATLPERPYIVTFDDGFESAWTTATKILAAHHAKAMMFVEGARTGTTVGRLTPDEVRAMAKSGVWEVESHGFAGHSGLPVASAPATLSPYWYANLAWLPQAHRLETPDEYEARVLEDLRRSKAFLENLSGAAVTVFAYPSGEYGQSVTAPSGADPDTVSADAGHSNAAGLTPRLFDALQKAGFTAAFAVVVPGSETAASPAYDRFAMPRVGGSPQVYQPDVQALSDGELPVPVVSPDYHWLDCKAVGATAQDMWIASSAAPFIYSLDDTTGRVLATVKVPQLQAGREGEPTLVGGFVARSDGTFIAYEQKGWWANGQARLISFRLDNGAPTDVSTTNLESAANWLVGVADVNGKLVGLTDRGDVLELDGPSVRPLFSLPNDAPGWNADSGGRFAGLAYANGLLYLADRKAAELLGVDPSSGAVGDQSPLPAGSDIRAVGGDDTYLWLVNWAQNRRMLTRLRAQ